MAAYEPSSSTVRPAKLAFCITELDPGGAERMLVELVTRLDRAAFSPLVYCLGPRPSGNPISLVDRLEDARIPVRCFGARRFTDLPTLMRKLRRQMASDRPDLVQTFLFHANVVGAWAAKRAGVPRVVTGIRVAERRSRWPLIVSRWADRWVDRHVCVSGSVRDFSAKRGLLPIEKLLVIPNAVDVDRFASASPISRDKLGTRNDSRLITCVGRIDRQKGSQWLVESLRSLLAARGDCELVLVGDGPDRRPLEQFCRDHGMNRVHFLGARADVPQILAATDVFVLPSRWEGMPNVVLEGMAAGRPIVSTDVEGVREALGNGADAQVVSPHDPAGFAALVEKLLDNPDSAARLGAENQLRARADFSFSAMTAAYETLYRGLLEKSQ